MSAKRILIIDDARDVGRMYQQALRTALPNIPISYVPSAEEAMVEVTAFKVDLMIVDIRLPGMSGFDLVRRVRSRQPSIKVMMITGMSLDGDIQRQSREVGASRLLAKPVSVGDFIAAVQEVLAEEAPTMPIPVEPPPSRRRTSPIRPVSEPLPEPPAVREHATAGPTLSDALTHLRGSLGALSALLLDDNGRVTAQAGDWPDPSLAERMVPNLMASLSALQKVSRSLGLPKPDAAQALRGKDVNLVVAPVGRYALLIFLPGGPAALRMALAFDEAMNTQKLLANILGEMGINIMPGTGDLPRLEELPGTAPAAPVEEVPEAEPEVEASPEQLKALEDLLEMPAPGAVVASAAAQDAESFWDLATSEETPPPANPDVLTYEQARKLGLLDQQ
ncbi:MAG: response regulator [Anaerolineae bacterium]|nr:response regulator [Anaerolineae bacterium]